MKSSIRHATFLLIHKKGQTKKKVTFSVPSLCGHPHVHQKLFNDSEEKEHNSFP